jgi:transposase InsO family protein
MIDPVTGWFEVAPLEEPSSYETQKAFDSYWLARYPRPQEVGMDNGSEFKKYFLDLIHNYGLKRKPSTEYNPQSNGIIERVHQVLGNILRSFELERRELDETNPWDEFLSAAAYAIRSTHHTTLDASPAQLVFNRDMLLPMTFVANWTRIRKQKQRRIDESNKRENATRIDHKYNVGDKVLLTTPGLLGKTQRPRVGPHRVIAVHNNGTVTIENGPVQQRVNIRRITPFWTRTDP